MAYTPISGSVPQFQQNAAGASANGYYLKGYSAGTTTPLSMGTDSTPTSTLAKCALNSRGEPISNDADETTVFIPHFNAPYKLVLYTNSTDADNNTTANAVWVVDNISVQFDASQLNYTASVTVEQRLDNLDVDSYATLRGLTSSQLSDSDIINVTNDGIAGQFVVKTGTVTDNGGTLIVFTDDSNRYVERVYSGPVNVLWFGADDTGVTAFTTALTNAFNLSLDVFIPGGTFLLDGSGFQIPGGGRLSGVTPSLQGGRTVIKRAATDYNTFFTTDETDQDFNGIVVENLYIQGGSSATWADVQNKWALESHYPFTQFKNIHIEHNSTYFGNGVRLHWDSETSGMGCWSSKIENVRFVGTTGNPTNNGATGFDLFINGGYVQVERCFISSVDQGIIVRQGENIRIDADIENIKGGAAGDRDKGAIVIGEPTAVKKVEGCEITGYIEGSARGIVLQNCTGVKIHSSYIDAIRAYNPDITSSDGFIYINKTAKGVSIENCEVQTQYQTQSCIYSESKYTVRDSRVFRNVTNSSGVPQTRSAGQVFDVAGTLPYLENVNAIQLDSANSSVAITAASNNGGEIQITATSHGLSTGDQVFVEGVGGVTNANKELWQVTYVDADNVVLDGSEFSGTYTSGGNIWIPTIDEYDGSATYNPPSLGTLTGATTTITVAGVDLGDYVIASFSVDLAGVTLSSWVSATNTVTCRFFNSTAGTIDLAQGTLRVRVIKKI